MLLAGYAHNDYANRHPLTDALALGYRGVEVDVFLVNGVLRVGHDVRAATRGATFDSLYLQPLRDIVARCRAQAGRAILLNVELKEASPATVAAWRALMSRYADMLAPSDDANGAPSALNVVLAGATDSGVPRTPIDSLLGAQCRLGKITSFAECHSDSQVRMLSLDYGKTMGRWWLTHHKRQEWLTMLAQAKAQAPGLLLRAYNVPASRAVYRELLNAGVDLIGTKTPAGTKRLLSEMLSGIPHRR